MNEEGDRKSLKTSAARRLVPIHSKLIEAGLLDYVQDMTNKKAINLFPDFSYDPEERLGATAEPSCAVGPEIEDACLP